jgi:hypothetical protein
MTETIQETKETKPEQPITPTSPLKHPRKPLPHHLVFVCGVVALLLLGFIGGQTFERARIRHFVGWQNNYEQNFFGDRGRPQRSGMMPLGMPPGGPFRSHAILGTVLSINNDIVSIQDNNGNVEQAINISNSTVIQKNTGKAQTSDLQPGQKIAVFGQPSGNGQISASLIRILGNASAAPSPRASASSASQITK